MVEVVIPEEAVVAACNAYEAAVESASEDDPRDPDDLSTHEEIAAVRAAAPLIEAAGYERAAREYEGLAFEFAHRAGSALDKAAAAKMMTKSETWSDAAEDLRGRASALRAQAC